MSRRFSGVFEVAEAMHAVAIRLLRMVRVVDTRAGVAPAQLSALSVLVFKGALSLGELAATEQVKPPTMSRIVTGLLRAKLVHRRTDKQDRRAVIIEATEKGVRILQEGRRRRVQALAAAVRSLPRKEIAQLRQAAQVMEHLSREV